MGKKFSILIIPQSGGRVRTYTISQFGAGVLLVIGICICGGTGWLVFEYGNIAKKSLKIRGLKRENQELQKEHEKFQLFAQEFNEFKHRTNKIANLLGIADRTAERAPRVAVSFNPKPPLSPNDAGSRFHRGGYPEIGQKMKDEKDIVLKEGGGSLIPSIYPVRGWISQRFSGTHSGVDFAAKLGTPVFSTMDGVVEDADWDEVFGNVVEITNERGFKTVYGHLSRVTILKGVRVRCGEVIGFVGSTGRSSAPHLHYEVWLNGVLQDPERYLIGR